MRDAPEQDFLRPLVPAGAGRTAVPLRRASLATLAAAGLLAASPLWGADPPAGVACLSDATRAAAAQSRVPEDQCDRLAELVAQAERAA